MSVRVVPTEAPADPKHGSDEEEDRRGVAMMAGMAVHDTARRLFRPSPAPLANQEAYGPEEEDHPRAAAAP
jgi:hypothetical protein